MSDSYHKNNDALLDILLMVTSNVGIKYKALEIAEKSRKYSLNSYTSTRELSIKRLNPRVLVPI